MSSKSALLRAQLKEKSILKVMGAHDALGAKLIEMHGFDAVWSSGFEIATAHGVPDANILTMTENLDAAININSATRLPVICDCDTGYGNANNVMHMVRKYEAAGMAALVIEDKRFPKVNSFIPGRQELASVEEFCGRMQAARAVQASDQGVMIFARLEALIAGWGVDEAYRRAVAYFEAGAEGFVIHSKSKNPDEIFAFAKLWNKKYKGACPLVSIPTTYFNVTANELAQEGFKISIYANQGMRASVKAMKEVFSAIQNEGTTRSIENRISPMEELFKLQGMPGYQEDEKKYSGDAEKIHAVIPAAADHKFQPDLESILKDKPLCMVKLADKSLLDRQIDTLRDAGVAGFSVVVGYQKDQVKAKEIKTIENPDFQSKGSAHSVMLGLEKQEGKTLVCYSDILFDQQIADALTDSPYAITLVIDRAFHSLPRRDKSLDLVITLDDTPAGSEPRRMELANYKKISKIGKQMESSVSPYEFIGMMLFSKIGLTQIKKAWQDAKKEFQNKPFYEASNTDQASMTDLLQYLIDTGADLRGLVIEHGWSELYSLGDYHRLEKFFSEKQAELASARP